MSLRMFHLGFISMAILFCLGASYRSFQLAQMQTAIPFQTMGGLSLLAAILLLAYSGWCLKNKKTNFLPALAIGFLCKSDLAFGCANCYGDGMSMMAQAANQGGFILLGLGVSLVATYVYLGFCWSRRELRP